MEKKRHDLYRRRFIKLAVFNFRLKNLTNNYISFESSLHTDHNCTTHNVV